MPPVFEYSLLPMNGSQYLLNLGAMLSLHLKRKTADWSRVIGQKAGQPIFPFRACNPPSVSKTPVSSPPSSPILDQSPSTQTLSEHKLPTMPGPGHCLCTAPAHPGWTRAPHSPEHLTPASSSCLQSLCPQGSAAQSHREDSRPPHRTSSSQMLPFPGPNAAAHTASRAGPQPSC